MSTPETNVIDPTPRTIGDLGPVGPLGFGCWRFTHTDRRRARVVLEQALDAGLTLVDTADVYGLDWGGTGFGSVESLLGEVLADAPELRERMVLATKGGIRPPVPYDSSPAWLRQACEDSLRRLRVETIDLYQIHRPDLLAHPGEVAATLAELHGAGKIRAVGVSNHTPVQHRALATHLADHGLRIASAQPEYSALQLTALRDGTFDQALTDRCAVLVWSPLAGGRLVTGQDVPGELLGVLDELAGREQVDRATVALAFALAHPVRPIVLVGSQSPERLAAAPRALSVQLDRHDVYRIIEASEGTPLP